LRTEFWPQNISESGRLERETTGQRVTDRLFCKDLTCACLPRDRALVLGRILVLLLSFVCSDNGLFHDVCISDFSSIIGK